MMDTGYPSISSLMRKTSTNEAGKGLREEEQQQQRAEPLWRSLFRLPAINIVANNDVTSSAAPSWEGGIDNQLSSHMIHVPDYLRQEHCHFIKEAKRELFAYEYVTKFGCKKSMAPKSIIDMVCGSCSSSSRSDATFGNAIINDKIFELSRPGNGDSGSDAHDRRYAMDIVANNEVTSSVTPSWPMEGGIDIQLSSHTIHVPEHLSETSHTVHGRLKHYRNYGISGHFGNAFFGNAVTNDKIFELRFPGNGDSGSDAHDSILAISGEASTSRSNNAGPELASDTNGGGSFRFAFDSGASDHFSGNPQLFPLLIEDEQVRQYAPVRVADGRELKISGRGPVDHGGVVTLNNVKYIRGLPMNYVSVSRLTREGYEVSFRGEGFTVREPDTGALVGRGHRDDVSGLFLVDFLRIPLDFSNL